MAEIESMLLTEKKQKVVLGFMETTESWKLTSRYFPCKVGGKPAWLDLKNLPSTNQLQCTNCNNPMIFLLQIYAEIDQIESCFHRSIFVFFCKDPGCCKPNDATTNFVAFRCQLPRKNEFYDYEPPLWDETNPGPSAEDFNVLCAVCGCLGPKRCAKCKVPYCSKHHQVIDWRNGHKETCQAVVSNHKESKYLIPEAEIIVESEDDSNQVAVERNEEERLKDYENYVNIHEKKLAEMSLPTNDEDLEAMSKSVEDKCFRRFKKRIQRDPTQILRYERGGSPLWVFSENIPKPEDIPKCSCGSNRQFEFQILPQLLNHLNLDTVEKSMDWGTLAIFTCEKNCEPENEAYHREFIWKQDFSESI